MPVDTPTCVVQVIGTVHGTIIEELHVGGVCRIQSLLELAGAELGLSSVCAGTEFVEIHQVSVYPVY